ncbi:MAG: cytochrome c oxidase subunit I [Bacteroidetes bacterium RIFCSPLOWO2_12_FULL_37_12]|nr:MAG: cytochrome c oxidase subunit I [Bacteroidetes bacterium RIFCSPLOWO2_12_FULL_37_12]
MNHKQNFWSHYIFSMDHKMIGKQYLFATIIMAIAGGVLSLLFRIQLANSGGETSKLIELFAGKWGEGGVLKPESYLAMITMHGTIMVFFVLTAGLIGIFANYLIPLQLGTRDMASPLLNMLSFWTFALSSFIMLFSMFVESGAASAGWTVYPPLSIFKGAIPGSGMGMTLWLISMAFFIVSTTMGSLNYVTTIINFRAVGMTLFRMPFLQWTIFLASILGLLTFPVLFGGALMMIFDRMFGTGFLFPKGLFIAGKVVAGGSGSPLLWQHILWYLGHPEVYIVLLPALGIVAEVLTTHARKPLFSYKLSVWNIILLSVLSIIVWGHHMFQSGMNPVLGEIFTITTLMISMPTAIVLLNLLLTLWKGNIHFTPPMLFGIGFIALFIPGALTGPFLASSTMDIQFHNTYFVVAHFHFTMATSSFFALFAGIYHWFPKMFGRVLNSSLGYIHFWISFIGSYCIFFPMFTLGISGVPRRYYGFGEFDYIPKSLQGMNEFITIVTIVVFCAQLLFLLNFFYNMFFGKKSEINPWESNTLEWTLDNPGHGNWNGKLPAVFRGPYEYSKPGVLKDYSPQDVEEEVRG